MPPPELARPPAVEIPPALRRAHRALGSTSERFLAFVEEHPECLARASFQALEAPNLLSPCVLQPWPVFVGPAKVAELARVSTGLCRLVRSVPWRFFDGRVARLDRYYGIDQRALTTVIVEEPNGFDGALARGDFLNTEAGIQCVELNFASHLGGWYMHHLLDLYLQTAPIRRFLQDLGRPFRVRSTVEVLLDHVLAEAVEHGLAEEGEVNLLFVLSQETSPPALAKFQADADPTWARVRAARKPGLGGALLFGSFAQLRERDGLLFLGEQRVHAVIEAEDSDTPPHVFRCFKAATVDLYNGLTSAILSDKRNLALLSEAVDTGLLEAAEEELVERHLPWTRVVAPRYTLYRGERVFLPDFLTAHRAALVLKPGRSTQGEGVSLGRFTPPAQWRETVETALAERGWIVQQEVRSSPLLCQLGERGCAPHELNWGLFVFGDRYGGGSLRMMPQGRGGVLNAALGATESLFIEVEES